MKYFSLILSILISILFLEFFVRFYIDDGLNYEIEMMKYANQLKIISKNIKHHGNLDCDAIVDKNGKVFFIDFIASCNASGV